jgi:hypothetical protein
MAMQLRDAQACADEVIGWLGPLCAEIAVAGSVRRQAATVGDIEIVARPAAAKIVPVFGRPLRSPLEERLAGLQEAGMLSPDGKNGSKYKRFRVPKYGVAVDLFLADAENWGNILAIRTGSAEFSHYLVTARWRGGLMPDGVVQKGGYLWRIEDMHGGEETSSLEKIACPTEAAFFAALGYEAVPEPELRDSQLARALWRMRQGAA